MTPLARGLTRVLVLFFCAGLGLALGAAMLQLPTPAGQLAVHVAAKLEASGVRHPVTAVLLNFRGYDTLLEIAVLLLALLGVLAASDSERSTGLRLSAAPLPLLQAMVRVLAPLMVLMAGYLLWAGAHRPGGAFQAGAVLAAAVVLLYLAGLIPAWAAPWQPPRPYRRGWQWRSWPAWPVSGSLSGSERVLRSEPVRGGRTARSRR